MKNKLLAITREGIPYLPQLKRVLKNTNATILMQQIEYWFHKKNGQPFYKFLSKPNKENKFYKNGDSWSEELVFSEKEVRTAFSKLGISYGSKRAFEETINSGKNVFRNERGEEFFYCSYHDKIKGITFYYRNNKYTDDFLDNLIKVEANDLDTPEIKGNPPKLPLGSYGDDQREFTELPQGKLHISDTTSNITTEEKSSSKKAEDKKILTLKFLDNYSLNEKTKSNIRKKIPKLTEENFKEIYNKMKKDPKVKSLNGAIYTALIGKWSTFKINSRQKEWQRGDAITPEELKEKIKYDLENLEKIKFEKSILLEEYNSLPTENKIKILETAKINYLEATGTKSMDILHKKIFASTKNTYIAEIMKQVKKE